MTTNLELDEDDDAPEIIGDRYQKISLEELQELYDSVGKTNIRYNQYGYYLKVANEFIEHGLTPCVCIDILTGNYIITSEENQKGTLN